MVVSLLLLCGCCSTARSRVPIRTAFIPLTDFSKFTSTPGAAPDELTLTSPEIPAPIDWNELVVSWNVTKDTWLKTEARVIYPDHTTAWYTLGLWSADPARHPRQSVAHQKDADARVNTDTLVLTRPATTVQLRFNVGQASCLSSNLQNRSLKPVTAQPADAVPVVADRQDACPTFKTASSAISNLKFIGLSFCNSLAMPAPVKPDESPCPRSAGFPACGFTGLSSPVISNGRLESRPNQQTGKSALPARGRELHVPERRQGEYENGGGWCSPVSLSMVLAYWAEQLHHPELDRPVPEIAAAVFDPVYNGTGNWPFNTAYAGQFPRLRAYVTRLNNLSDVEDWIAAGVPVILSVSSYLTNDRHAGPDNGHLIVCTGFTKNGDVIANNPGVSVKRHQPARQIYSRKRVIAAWQKSHNTVYLIYPEDMAVPRQ